MLVLMKTQSLHSEMHYNFAIVVLKEHTQGLNCWQVVAMPTQMMTQTGKFKLGTVDLYKLYMLNIKAHYTGLATR